MGSLTPGPCGAAGHQSSAAFVVHRHEMLRKVNVCAHHQGPPLLQDWASHWPSLSFQSLTLKTGIGTLPTMQIDCKNHMRGCHPSVWHSKRNCQASTSANIMVQWDTSGHTQFRDLRFHLLLLHEPIKSQGQQRQVKTQRAEQLRGPGLG